ncbi:MAG: sensor histidine kinase [Bacteriovoracaceae bacterium]
MNLGLLSSFVYYNFRKELINRVEQHLISVRELAEQKLKLYFELLEKEIDQNPGDLSKRKEYLGYCSLKSRPQCPTAEEFIHIHYHTLTLTSQNTITYKRKVKNDELVWFFDFEGISSILSQREGLGDSGEIYLVGKDHNIKSASRFIKEWRTLYLNNQSIEKGLSGLKGVEVVLDYRNVKVVSAYTYFKYKNLEFILLSEIDWEEINYPINKIFFQLIFGTSFLIIFSLGLAYILTKKIINQIDVMKDEINKLNQEKVEFAHEAFNNIMKAQEDEREKFAINLHDSIGQYLTALKWKISLTKSETKESSTEKNLSEAAQICETTIHEVRTISHDLMPSLIKDLGPFYAIKDLIDRQNKIYSINIDFNFDEEVLKLILKKNFQINIYRMVQELIQNAVKHSKASIVSIHFSKEDNYLILDYVDNGIGINKELPLPRSLTYRTELFKGKIQKLESESGLNYLISFNLKEICNE